MTSSESSTPRLGWLVGPTGVSRPIIHLSFWWNSDLIPSKLLLQAAYHQQCFYRPQRSWGKVIFSQVSVILSTWGGCAWSRGAAWSGGSAPGGPGGDPLGWLLLQAVCILLECILVCACLSLILMADNMNSSQNIRHKDGIRKLQKVQNYS